MYVKLIVTRIVAYLFYLAGTLWFIAALLRLFFGNDGWPTLLQSLPLIFTGLFMDVLADIGMRVEGIKTEQEQIRTEIEQLKP